MEQIFPVCYVRLAVRLVMFCCASSSAGATCNVNNKMGSAGEPRQPALLFMLTANCDNAHCLAGIGEFNEYSKELRLC
jgi:hypothetical protein